MSKIWVELSSSVVLAESPFGLVNAVAHVSVRS